MTFSTTLIRRSLVTGKPSKALVPTLSSFMSNQSMRDTNKSTTYKQHFNRNISSFTSVESPSLSNQHRHKSTQLSYVKEEDAEIGVEEVVNFPSSNKAENETPVLLNSKEHAVGYLNKILNARVYEAAIETQLQYAKSLSMVSFCTKLAYSSIWSYSEVISLTPLTQMWQI